MTTFCYLPVGDTKIAVHALGVGEPAVMLHSSASSGTQWRAADDALATRYRIRMPDFPGCGSSAGAKAA